MKMSAKRNLTPKGKCEIQILLSVNAAQELFQTKHKTIRSQKLYSLVYSVVSPWSSVDKNGRCVHTVSRMDGCGVFSQAVDWLYNVVSETDLISSASAADLPISQTSYWEITWSSNMTNHTGSSAGSRLEGKLFVFESTTLLESVWRQFC